MRRTSALLIGMLLGHAWAAEAPGQSFDIRVNLEDKRELRLAATVQDLTSHTLQIEGSLGVQLRITEMGSGGRWIAVSLANLQGQTPRPLVIADWPWRTGEPWHVQWISFSVCGERIIAVRDGAPGRCADLLPMAKTDRPLGNCGPGGLMCLGPYEEMPANLGSRSRIAPADEPGVPLGVSGTVTGADGRPRAGVIVYGYQTNAHGEYPRVFPPRSFASQFQGRLRGWARTDAQGRYSFETIRPGSYGGNPEHIHMHVIEPGCATYPISDLVFDDDPNLLALTPEQRKGYEAAQGGNGITRLRRKGEGWEVTRDIRLGQNIPEYTPCPNR